MILEVELSDAQYARFKAALKKLRESEDEPSDADLAAQLKREAAAVTCAVENQHGQIEDWSF